MGFRLYYNQHHQETINALVLNTIYKTDAARRNIKKSQKRQYLKHFAYFLF